MISVQSVLQHLASLPPETPSTPTCSCCCPSLLVSTLLQCDSSHVESLPLNLQLIDQCTVLVSAAVESPLHLWPSHLSALFQESLLTRLACLRPSFQSLHAARSADYERLLKLTLMALMLVHDTPSPELNPDSLHQSLASERFFPTLLQYFQCMMDGRISLARTHVAMHTCSRLLTSIPLRSCLVVVSVPADADPKSASAASNSSGPSSKDRRDQILFELQGLFEVASRSLRLSEARRTLIAQSFDVGHGGQWSALMRAGLLFSCRLLTAASVFVFFAAPAVEEDVQWLGPTSLAASSAASSFAAPTAAHRLAVQDPWLMIEGLSSSPFIDLMYDRSVHQ